MIRLDVSIIPAILIFLALLLALNSLLFRPLLRIMDEREARTTGLMALARKNLDHHLDLFQKYQEAIKNVRLEGYRKQEAVRSEAMRKRAEALEQAKLTAESLIEESRATIQAQVNSAKERLSTEAREIARGIASNLLERPV